MSQSIALGQFVYVLSYFCANKIRIDELLYWKMQSLCCRIAAHASHSTRCLRKSPQMEKERLAVTFPFSKFECLPSRLPKWEPYIIDWQVISQTDSQVKSVTRWNFIAVHKIFNRSFWLVNIKFFLFTLFFSHNFAQNWFRCWIIDIWFGNGYIHIISIREIVRLNVKRKWPNSCEWRINKYGWGAKWKENVRSLLVTSQFDTHQNYVSRTHAHSIPFLNWHFNLRSEFFDLFFFYSFLGIIKLFTISCADSCLSFFRLDEADTHTHKETKDRKGKTPPHHG